jgi:hypothetical protein
VRIRAPSPTSAPDPIAHVGDAVIPLEVPCAVQLDVHGIELVEEAPPLTEENRDDVDLELVEDAGGECELRRAGAVDEHVPVARSLLARVIAVSTSET